MRTEFFFGVGLDRDGKEISADVLKWSLTRIENRAVDLHGGFTMVETRGGWSDGGMRHLEPGRVLTIFGPISSDKVRQMAQLIKAALNQSSVLVVQTNPMIEYYD